MPRSCPNGRRLLGRQGMWAFNPDAYLSATSENACTPLAREKRFTTSGGSRRALLWHRPGSFVYHHMTYSREPQVHDRPAP